MKKSIVLYDSKCDFCNKWIGFFKKKIDNKEISFIPLESEKGVELLENFKIKDLDSVVFIKDNMFYLKSKAVLKIFSNLIFPYYLLNYFSLIPEIFLNIGYDFIAKRRFKIYSKKDCCDGK